MAALTRGDICNGKLRKRRKLSLLIRTKRRGILFSANTSSLFLQGTHLLKLSLDSIRCIILSRKRHSRAKKLCTFLGVGDMTGIIYGHRMFQGGFGGRHRGKVLRPRTLSGSHF